jgi:PilZ domain
MGNNAKEKRGGTRKKTLKGGAIVYQNGNCSMNCTIVDISDTGAKLKPADPVYVPETFDLVLPNGPTYRCVLIRRTKDQIAVRFR